MDIIGKRHLEDLSDIPSKCENNGCNSYMLCRAVFLTFRIIVGVEFSTLTVLIDRNCFNFQVVVIKYAIDFYI
jgi:hypothetical protein